MPRKHFPLTTSAAIERIRSRNETLCTFVTTRLEEAEREASEASDGPLAGVPYSLKDAWDTAGVRTTGGSWRFRDRMPERSAGIHEALAQTGAVLLGKTNLSDLSVSPEASSHVGGSTRNPHNLERTSGGSSGGAAAAVADGMTAFDWGSDIGGSIRLPAAFCGVYGMRLSSEAWPIEGYFPPPPPTMAWMNGQGPITASLAQMRALLQLVAPKMKVATERPFVLQGAQLYAPKHGRWPTFEQDVRPALSGAVDEVRADHDLIPPHKAAKLAIAVWGSHFDALLEADPMTFREGVGALTGALLFGGKRDKRLHPRTAEVMGLVLLGRYTLFRDPERALANAHAYRAEVTALWDQGQVLVSPVTAFPAPRIGTTNRNTHLLDCTFPGNVADATGLAMPFGTFDDGMPRAIQLMGPPGSELVLLDMAERIERTMSG